MDLTNKETLTQILSKNHLWAQKRLGQNFLVDKEILAKIIQIAQLEKTDYVIEVGCGVGTLTQALCQAARWILGVEVDPNMIKILKETCGHFVNLKIVQKNILGLDLAKVLGQVKEYKVVANLPYYITQPILRYFLENPVKPKEMILMVQNEMAKKICAEPGEMSLLSISVQYYADPIYIKKVLAKSFFPIPKVDSAIIKLKNIQEKFSNLDEALFFRIAKAGFSGKRKQLHNSLAAGLAKENDEIKSILKKARIDFSRRAETLSLKEWYEIYKFFQT